MKPSCPVIHGKEKENAGEKIKSQRVHITHPMSGEEFIGKSPRTNEKQADRGEKLRVPIKELIEKIGKHVPERAAVIDCRLPASRAEMPAQKRAAILAMRERLTLRFPPAEKASPTRWCLFNRRDYRIAQNKLCYFIGHIESLGKPDANVYSDCGRALLPAGGSDNEARCLIVPQPSWLCREKR